MQQLLHNVQPTSINDIVDQEIFLHFPFDIAERRTPALLFKKKTLKDVNFSKIFCIGDLLKDHFFKKNVLDKYC
jgi:hypothetical protein